MDAYFLPLLVSNWRLAAIVGRIWGENSKEDDTDERQWARRCLSESSNTGATRSETIAKPAFEKRISPFTGATMKCSQLNGLSMPELPSISKIGSMKASKGRQREPFGYTAQLPGHTLRSSGLTYRSFTLRLALCFSLHHFVYQVFLNCFRFNSDLCSVGLVLPECNLRLLSLYQSIINVSTKKNPGGFQGFFSRISIAYV